MVTVSEQAVEMSAQVLTHLNRIDRYLEKGRLDLAKEEVATAIERANLVSTELVNAYNERQS